jgi:5'-deoxynucleotidase YfbR-like HD superfamily hydrolase
MNIYYYRRLKNVNRLGCEPIMRSYNLLEHSYMVTVLFCHFAKEERILYDIDVLEAILHHDMLETVTGDLPYNIKNLSPTTQTCWEAIESEAINSFPQLAPYTDVRLRKTMSKKQFKIFKVCDLLDLWIFLREEQRLGNTALPIHEIITKCKSIIEGKYKSIDKYMTDGYTF